MLALIARSIALGWALVGVELAAVAVMHRAEIASVWELQFGSLWLLPAALLTSAPVSALGALLARSARSPQHWLGRLGLIVICGGFTAAVLWGVSSGRLLNPWQRRMPFIALPTLAVAAASVGVVPRLAQLLGRWRAARPALVWLGAGVVLVALELLNRFALVRLYPAFHLGLAALVLLMAPLALDPAPVERRRSGWSWVPVALVVLASVALVPAASRLRHFDNFRFILDESAPMLRHAVAAASLVARLASESAPPSSASEASAVEASSAAPDFRGRSILLVTVDALRADHLGSYGYPRATSPNFDALAEEAVLFERAYCATPHTSYSVVSLMTGKYIRPLLLQGAGHDSETWAGLLRTYGYRTAAFHPPAIFFIDEQRFDTFKHNQLGFEYQKEEYLEGALRVQQVKQYLSGAGNEPVFVWVHLFGPHEPYEAHPEHSFGQRDIDRYDSEIAAADVTIGDLVALFRERDPDSVVIVSADHGEEFEDHGGRYHGTTVYEEQVRVPLLISAPKLAPRRIAEPVSLVDLLPTLLQSLDVPTRPRIRGRNLGPLLLGRPEGKGFAFAETDDYTLLAEGKYRLVCARRLGACQLYDVVEDPAQTQVINAAHTERVQRMRTRLRELGASHGRFEKEGLRAEGKGWPSAILRGIAGDGDAAPEIAALLDDADVAIRRQAARLLFELAHAETAAALRLALERDEDPQVRAFCALALTRLGEGAALTVDLLDSEQLELRRWAALALAETGDDRGREILVNWWMKPKQRNFETTRQLLAALAQIKAKEISWEIAKALPDVRLRPDVARCLAGIGDKTAIGPLVAALRSERYQGTREVLVRALVELGASTEFVEPLIRFLGTPDPLQNGLEAATDTGVLEYVGGPDSGGLKRLERDQHAGVRLRVIVPKRGNGRGVRLLIQAANVGPEVGRVYVGKPAHGATYNLKGEPVNPRFPSQIHPEYHLAFELQPGVESHQLHALVPDSFELAAGRSSELVLFADAGVEVRSLAAVPLSDELPPPEPKAWKPTGPPTAEASPQGAKDDDG